MTYFSQIYKKPVYDDRGYKIGLLRDLVFRDGTELGEITHFVLEINRKKLKFPWKFVASVSHDIHLNTVKEKTPCWETDETDMLVNESLMDKQLVDTNGLKVVRVNDVLLSKTNGSFYVLGVSFGLRSLLRRLELEKIALWINPKMKPQIVPWIFVQQLSLSPAHISLNLAGGKINEVHPSDIADLLDELSHSERQILFNVLNDEKAAETLIEAGPKVQKSLIEHLQERKFSSVLNKLSPAEMADLLNTLSNLPKEKIVMLVKQMDRKILKKIGKIIESPEKCASDLMRKEFFTINEGETAGRLKKLVKKAKWAEEPHRVYVVNSENALAGEITIKQLLLAKSKSKIGEIMNRNVVSLGVKEPLKKVIQVFSNQHLAELPVADEKKTLVGIISMNDVFEEVTPKKWNRIRMIADRVNEKLTYKK
ncbi:MAG: CBS domain-containing protein [Candidatus ainarchaeum sp.]|nr:CBS domain-containing protein [Candidatus ainarchaeum sp.]